MIYIDIRALLQLNSIYTKFPELPRQKIVFRIIKALWNEEYDELTLKWKTNKKDYEQKPRESPSLPQTPIQEPKLPPNEPSQDIRH